MQPVQFLNNMNAAAQAGNRQMGMMKDIPVAAMMRNPDVGLYFHRRFHTFRLSTNINAAQAYWANGILVFGDNGASIAAITAQQGGITIASDGDNEGASLAQSNAPFKISRATRRAWFEAEIQVSALTDAKNNVLLGLGDTATALSAVVPITAAGALADLNFVGFQRPESARTVAGTGGAIMNTTYKADGIAQVNVQTDAVTLVPATWTRLGFRYDKDIGPFNANPYTLTFFQDDVPLATQLVIAAADGTDFPNDINLGFIFAILNATGATPGTASIRQVTAAQLLLPELAA